MLFQATNPDNFIAPVHRLVSKRKGKQVISSIPSVETRQGDQLMANHLDGGLYIGNTVRCTIAMANSLLTIDATMRTTNRRDCIVVVANVNCDEIRPYLKLEILGIHTSKPSRIDIAMTPEEESAEHWLGHDVENTVEHSFRVWRDDVSSFRKSPCDGVQEPKEDGPNTANEVSSRDVCAKSGSVLASSPNNRPRNKEEGYVAEDEVSPLQTRSVMFPIVIDRCSYLVRRCDQGTNQPSNDHDLIDQYCVENSRPRKTSSQEQVHQQKRGSDDP